MTKSVTILIYRHGPEVIKLFSCSTQLSIKFKLLIDIEIAHQNQSFIKEEQSDPGSALFAIVSSSFGVICLL